MKTYCATRRDNQEYLIPSDERRRELIIHHDSSTSKAIGADIGIRDGEVSLWTDASECGSGEGEGDVGEQRLKPGHGV